MGTSKSHIWNKLKNHHKNLSKTKTSFLFEQDKNRFADFSIRYKNLCLDFSKNRLTNETINLLIELAKHLNVENKIHDMFIGEKINNTESRPALHVALRGGGSYQNKADVKSALLKMGELVSQILSGQMRGATNKIITNVVNIGIGGSHLGPEMAINALLPYHNPHIRVHFVSNIDGHDLDSTLRDINGETTIFIIASKTFTTEETIANATSARNWLKTKIGDGSTKKHFVAISENKEEAIKFGINPNLILPLWGWVGGRFSLWSTIGFSIALQVGMKNFEDLIKGGNDMDIHFHETPIRKNLPIMLALVGIWNINFECYNSLAILPYDHRLGRFPAFIQQLDMESSGKSVSKADNLLDIMTGPVVFGEPGTNSQHAFFQSLHQGTHTIPADFIIIANAKHQLNEHHQKLISNALAQTRALMYGKTFEESHGENFRTFRGGRPTNTLLIRDLSPRSLGQLVALYEHKVFVQGIIWDINTFDQWGVQLGKEMAKDVLSKIHSSNGIETLDSSSKGLIKLLKKWQL